MREDGGGRRVATLRPPRPTMHAKESRSHGVQSSKARGKEGIGEKEYENGKSGGLPAGPPHAVAASPAAPPNQWRPPPPFSRSDAMSKRRGRSITAAGAHFQLVCALEVISKAPVANLGAAKEDLPISAGTAHGADVRCAVTLPGSAPALSTEVIVLARRARPALLGRSAVDANSNEGHCVRNGRYLRGSPRSHADNIRRIFNGLRRQVLLNCVMFFLAVPPHAPMYSSELSTTHSPNRDFTRIAQSGRRPCAPGASGPDGTDCGGHSGHSRRNTPLLCSTMTSKPRGEGNNSQRR